ncbi:MAG: hypothetical protein LBP39_01725 [Rickettsiales bacterium]|jgi:hypothetical protein|nr:hypothetical protein [Rickettsiales bacterium]
MISKKNLKNIIVAGIDRDIVLFEDVIDVENIETEHVNEYRFISDDARKFIDNNFHSKQEASHGLRDSSLLGLTNFDFYGGKVFINFEKGNYKTYLATIEPRYREYIGKENFFIVPISTINLVITKDKKIILTKADQKQFTAICGFPGEDDVSSEKINLSGYFLKEIFRKIGNLYLYDTKLLGIFKANCCFLIVKHQTDYRSKEIEEIYNANAESRKASGNTAEIAFVKNREEDIGEVIKSPNFSRETRHAFKFYIKNIFYNYKYINTKIE